MFRRRLLAATAAFSVLAASSSLADETKVVITVTKEKTTDPGDTKPPFEGKRASVDVALLLDTSNSMDGLINQAKSQLWTIVQQFAKAEKNGQTPSLRVALFEYGNTRLPASEGYIRQVVPLTDNLDKLSEALFALSTSGGDEYCGQVINEAITRLDWSKEPNGYKAIFIAGNEPFTQGEVDYHKACKRAIENGVVVNTIHCGNSKIGVSGKWKHGAELAEGEFFNIDQDRVYVHIKCPQDQRILELSQQINGTYLWCGSKSFRSYNLRNQAIQDNNARGLSAESSVQRAVTKGSKIYDNRGRDIVDSVAKDKDALKKLKKEELPEEMQKMTPEEREAHVKKMTEKREAIKKELAKLSKEREAYLAKERKKQSEAKGEKTLGDAVVTTVNKQLKASGFKTAE